LQVGAEEDKIERNGKATESVAIGTKQAVCEVCREFA
jgi:hypothetical protein